MNEVKDAFKPETEESAAPLKLDVRVTPISPKDNLIGFANITIADSLVVEGLKVCSGEKGIYVNMPSLQGKDGQWRDIVKPITSQFRAQVTEAVSEAYGVAIEKMQATVEAARSAAMPPEGREGAHENTKDTKADRQATAMGSAEEKGSALEALEKGKKQAMAQPAKAQSDKEAVAR
jgi:stage V sporulation protein G